MLNSEHNSSLPSVHSSETSFKYSATSRKMMTKNGSWPTENPAPKMAHAGPSCV